MTPKQEQFARLYVEAQHFCFAHRGRYRRAALRGKGCQCRRPCLLQFV